MIGGREEIPTLAALFDAFPETRFNIDIKSEGAVSTLADFLNAREAWDRVLVGSFSRRRLQRFRQPGQPAGADLCHTGRGGALPLPPERPARRPAHPRVRRVPGSAPARTAAGRPPAGWSGGPTPRASTSTSGPSTRPTRCTSCSTSGSTDSSPIAPICSRMSSSPGDSGGARVRDDMTVPRTDSGASGIADLGPLNRAKEQKAWYFYDWANSAFATTIAGVLFGPYIKEIAENAAVDNRISVHRHLDRPGRPAGVRHHRLDDPVRDPAPVAGGGRGPHVAQEGSAGRFRMGRLRGGGPAVLRDRRQLAARRASRSWSPTSASPRRRSSTTPSCR